MLSRPIRNRRKNSRFRSDDSDSSADRSSPSCQRNATTKKRTKTVVPTLAEEEEYELVQELKTLAARLGRNDPELRRVELLPRSRRCSSLLGSFWLENMFVCQALQECWSALRGNRHVRHLVLKALPAAELAVALRDAAGLQDLQHLWIQQTLPSQSIECSDALRLVLLTAHMPIPSLQRTGLQSLCLDIRLTVTTQLQLDALSLDVRLLTRLKNVQLHLEPCCPPQYPTLSIQSLLQAFADLTNSHQNLTRLQLTLGYAQYPFQQPMIQNGDVLELLLSSSSSLERLQLDNFGFRNEHLRVVTRALQTNTTLQDLHLGASGVFSVPAVQALCEVLQQRSNVTLQSCIVVVRSPLSDGPIRLHQNNNMHQHQHHCNAMELRWQQEHLNLWCFLNRLLQEALLVVGRTQPRAPTHREWCEMIFRVDQSLRSRRTDAAVAAAVSTTITPRQRGRRNEQQPQQPLKRRSPRTPPMSVLFLGLDRDEDDKLPPPPPSEEDMARNRCSLGTLYTLLRSHPQHIVSSVAERVQVVASTTRSLHLEEASTTSAPSPLPSLQTIGAEASASLSIHADGKRRKTSNSLPEQCHRSPYRMKFDADHSAKPQPTHHPQNMLEDNKVARSLDLDRIHHDDHTVGRPTIDSVPADFRNIRETAMPCKYLHNTESSIVLSE